MAIARCITATAFLGGFALGLAAPAGAWGPPGPAPFPADFQTNGHYIGTQIDPKTGQPLIIDCSQAAGSTCTANAGCVVAAGASCTPNLTVCAPNNSPCPSTGSCPAAAGEGEGEGGGAGEGEGEGEGGTQPSGCGCSAQEPASFAGLAFAGAGLAGLALARRRRS